MYNIHIVGTDYWHSICNINKINYMSKKSEVKPVAEKLTAKEKRRKMHSR